MAHEIRKCFYLTFFLMNPNLKYKTNLNGPLILLKNEM